MRRSTQSQSARRLADDAGDLTSRPKYAPMPEFGVVILESRHSLDWAAPGWFDEDFNKFLLLISGSVRIRTRTRQHHLGPGSFCHALAHTPHLVEDLPGDPVVLYVIHYRPHILPDDLSEVLGSVPLWHWNFSGSATVLVRPIRVTFQEMLFEQTTRRIGWEAMMTSGLVRVAVRAARLGTRNTAREVQPDIKATPSTDRVVAYLARLETSFYQQETLESAAQGMGLSRRQFTRIFRQLTGTTWRHCVQTLRLKHACKLLMGSTSSILSISFECGFESHSNFHRAFRAAFGCAPSAFREKNQRA
ncbi:MAG: helix-turn-helix domain-containing protein [Verrucomicrobiales bacterium]